MFYRTQIKSITDSTVTDKDGKSLQFIGDLPVKPGDWVFTDGKFIFGNAPPRGSPAVIAEDPCGIPILGDENFLSEKDEILRGYFDKNARFKKYPIVQDDWIVNSEKNFAHGSDIFEEGNVIDADIRDDGNMMIVTGGFFLSYNVVKSNFVAFTVDSRLFFGSNLWISRLKVHDMELGTEILPDDDAPTRFFQIRDSGTHKDDLNLDPFADDVEESARYMTADQMVNVYARALPKDYPSTAEPLPDEPVIVQTSVQILSCFPNANNDSGIGGIVFASCYGYCFPHTDWRFVKGWEYFFASALEAEGFSWNGYRLDEQKCVPFGFSAFYLITDDAPEPISFRYYGGVIYDEVVVETQGGNAVLSDSGGGSYSSLLDALRYRHVELTADLQDSDIFDTMLFPVADGFFSFNKFGLLTFYNSKGELVAEDIPIHDDFLYVEVLHGEFDWHPLIFLFNNKPHIICNLYTSDGSVEEKGIKGVIDEINETAETKIPAIDGFYIRRGDDSLEPLQFTPLFHQFNDGSYLYGVRGGKLFYKSKNGKETLIGDGIKNFRLNELKNISKAKR